MYRELCIAAESAVVMVVCRDINSKGSGFFADSAGYVVTNNHVVARLTLQDGVLSATYSSAISVVGGGTTYPASLVNNPNDDRPVVYGLVTK